MSSVDLLLAAVQSLRANVLRSVLTALGMIIGVGAVITMVAVGSGAQAGIESVIDSIGANMLQVTPSSGRQGGANQGAGSRPTLSWEDANAIEREIPAALAVAPSVRGTAQIIFGSANWRTAVEGITQSYFQVRGWSIGQGREFEEWEITGGDKLAVIGATIAEALFPGENPLGQVVRIDRVPFEVVGILTAKGQSSFGRDQDDVIFVPLKAAQQRLLGLRLVRPDSVEVISILARTPELVSVVEREIAEVLRDRHGIRPGADDDFRIRNISEIFEARAESSRVMALLLAAVASVSLLVGGIGIMNIMLVSVTERTREIGIRMAVGAGRRDVLMQFLIEALALSIVGGTIGILAGIAASRLTAGLAEWPLRLEGSAILLAFGFSAAIGIFFGYYPARKAARLDPIEALRYE